MRRVPETYPPLLDTLGVMLPRRPRETLLLGACLLSGEAGITAWRRWLSAVRDPKAYFSATASGPKRLLPLLCHALGEHGRAAGEMLPYLRTALVWERRRTAAFDVVFREVTSALRQVDIDPIVLRGAALAGTVYVEPALRHCHDLDLLVWPEELTRASLALSRGGVVKESAPQTTRSGSVALRHRDGLPVVLHTRPFALSLYTPPMADMQARARVRTIAGERARIFAPSDALLHVCGHASYRPNRSLVWVCDAVQLSKSAADDAVDWDVFVNAATESGLALPLFLALSYLSNELIEVPERVLDRLRDEALRAPDVLLDAALHGVNVGARFGVVSLFRSSGWLSRAHLARWLVMPSRDYLRYWCELRERPFSRFAYVARPLRTLADAMP